MRTELAINGSTDPATMFLTWAPLQAQVRLADATGAAAPVAVKLRNKNTASGGQVIFYAAPNSAAQAELQVTLPADGSRVPVLIGGVFGKPSTESGDAIVEVATMPGNQVLSSTPMMVRIRKNANSLTSSERNRFRAAFATLNNRGLGKFADFRNIHTLAGSPEAHGNAGFLPWHRGYLLDLERALQAIDPTVALPYWRFDQPAPKVFDPGFMGVADSVGNVRFNPDNPLQFWSTDGTPGIIRNPHFNVQTQSAFVSSEAVTLRRGSPGAMYERFRNMEGDPHGTAHTSFGGSISQIPTAAKDPLFFMLHANVDRLWAKWQWLNHRFDVTSTSTYSFLGKSGQPGATRIGHNLQDTMWPWNGITGGQRPPTAPGGAFPPSTLTAAPGATPTPGSLIDYQGHFSSARWLAFDYDDVPYEAH